MKEETRRAIVGTSTVISLYLVLMFVTVLITEHFNVSHPLAGSGSAILTLLGSPFAFVLAAISTWASHRLIARPWVKVCLTVVNGLGAVVAGMYTFGLFALWRMGPINPG